MEAASRLGISHDTVTRLVARGELPAIRVSARVIRIPVPAVERHERGMVAVARGVERVHTTAGASFGEGEKVPGEARGATDGAAAAGSWLAGPPRMTSRGCEVYLAGLAERMEQAGVVLSDPPSSGFCVITDDDADGLSFRVAGELSIAGGTPSRVEIREEFVPVGGGFVGRARYAYELVDPERDLRRAFHLHSAGSFARAFLVLVHEHEERPIGRADDAFYAGWPVEDAYTGFDLLLRAWMDDLPDADGLRPLG